MLHYLFKVLILVLFSAFIIFSYYYGAPSHIENFDGYLPYIIPMIFIYGTYKYLQIGFCSENMRVKFTPLGIFGLFLFHLFVLCCVFFYMNGHPMVGGFVLFLKILFFSFLPLSILIVSSAFGKKVLLKLFEYYKKSDYLKEERVFTLLGSIGVGFFSFLFLIACFGVIGFYNLWIVFAILVGFGYYAYRELCDIFRLFVDEKYIFDIKEGGYLHFLSVEFLFLVSTLLLSVNLISIVRPFPIGWDDLGVYMNNPHLFAAAKSLVAFGGMYAWQTFTGIGYLFGSATQAFFFNVVGSFLSFIVLIYVVSDFLKGIKKTFVNIPLLIGTLFISMPMVVFQQAKDMKLDTGLFFVSVIVVYLLYKIYLSFSENKNLDIKENAKKSQQSFSKDLLIGLIFIIGLLAGFAFTIKFTSLLLISALIGVLFYASFGFFGFLGYLSVFFAIFTLGGLWGYMNVIVNPNNIANFDTTFFIISATIGILFFLFSIRLSWKRGKLICLREFFTQLGVFLLGVFIALIPWVGKNIVVSYPDISIGTMLLGKSDSFQLDLEKIYTQDEITKIDEGIENRRISESGTTADEDLGRYFGYEKGINNYIKLPWNLTMQTNQGGEFTNIGFFFLALLPVVLLFLPYRKRYMAYGVGGFLLLEILIFRFGFFSSFMGSFVLPFGYAVILGLFLLPLFFFLYFLDASKKLIRLFQLNLVFASFYTFLWTVSAFGIVWYGIVMYFSFLLMIAIGGYYIASYSKDIHVGSKDFLIKGLGSICFFGVLLIYFLNSVSPHTFINLKGAGYTPYKLSKINKYEAPFLYHKEYLPMLFELNIAPEKRKEFIDGTFQSDAIKDFITTNNGGEDIVFIVGLLNELKKSDKIPQNVKREANKTIYNIYKGIAKPEKNQQNREGVYRIGTFLKYHILENNKRLLEDSLIFNFDDYIYNEDAGVTVDNMKKLGLKYLLVDLNAATIDKDSRRNLTRRYEGLLSTFHSDKLELIETDSMCLKVALEKYSKDGNIDEYMTIAGVNFDSYKIEDKVSQKIGRGDKLIKCYNYIHSLVKNKQVTETNFSLLVPYAEYIEQNKEKLHNDDEIRKFLHAQFGKSFKALFKIKD